MVPKITESHIAQSAVRFVSQELTPQQYEKLTAIGEAITSSNPLKRIPADAKSLWQHIAGLVHGGGYVEKVNQAIKDGMKR